MNSVVDEADKGKGVTAAVARARDPEVPRHTWGNYWDPPPGSPGNGRRKRAFHRALKRKEPRALVEQCMRNLMAEQFRKLLEPSPFENIWKANVEMVGLRGVVSTKE